MAKKASVLRRRKSRNGKMQFSPTNDGGDDDAVFEVEEGRTGESNENFHSTIFGFDVVL